MYSDPVFLESNLDPVSRAPEARRPSSQKNGPEKHLALFLGGLAASSAQQIPVVFRDHQKR